MTQTEELSLPPAASEMVSINKDIVRRALLPIGWYLLTQTGFELPEWAGRNMQEKIPNFYQKLRDCDPIAIGWICELAKSRPCEISEVWLVITADLAESEIEF